MRARRHSHSRWHWCRGLLAPRSRSECVVSRRRVVVRVVDKSSKAPIARGDFSCSLHWRLLLVGRRCGRHRHRWRRRSKQVKLPAGGSDVHMAGGWVVVPRGLRRVRARNKRERAAAWCARRGAGQRAGKYAAAARAPRLASPPGLALSLSHFTSTGVCHHTRGDQKPKLWCLPRIKVGGRERRR